MFCFFRVRRCSIICRRASASEGLRPQIPTGALHLDHTGGLRSLDSLTNSQFKTRGSAPTERSEPMIAEDRHVIRTNSRVVSIRIVALVDRRRRPCAWREATFSRRFCCSASRRTSWRRRASVGALAGSTGRRTLADIAGKRTAALPCASAHVPAAATVARTPCRKWRTCNKTGFHEIRPLIT